MNHRAGCRPAARVGTEHGHRKPTVAVIVVKKNATGAARSDLTRNNYQDKGLFPLKRRNSVSVLPFDGGVLFREIFAVGRTHFRHNP